MHFIALLTFWLIDLWNSGPTEPKLTVAEIVELIRSEGGTLSEIELWSEPATGEAEAAGLIRYVPMSWGAEGWWQLA